nr:12116_t:CDS:10 [Entrophospora candida]
MVIRSTNDQSGGSFLQLRRAREERKVFSQASQEQKEKSNRKDLDEFVKSVLQDKPDQEESDTISEKTHTRASSISVSTHFGHNSPSVSVPQSPQITTPANSRFIPGFTTFEAIILDIAPKEVVLYNKEVQTAENSFGPPANSQNFKDLSEVERKKVYNSAEFIDFIDHTTKIVERALNENYDFMRDYTISGKEERQVTKNAELCVTSYNKNPMAMNEPDGVVLVWNLHLIERPEFVFHSQSDVLTTMFSEFHPTLIVGGTYSGQIVLWDMRAKSLPVHKTPLSAAGHTHPVYSMQMVGTQNAHNLLTASTDGLETLELVHTDHSKTNEVSITSLGFPDNETAAFFVGTEEGNLYQANRYGRAGGKAGINPYDTYKGHWGPITGLHFHPLVGPVDFSDMFLTSSVDWTVKLWRAKSISKPSHSPQTIAPIYSFEGADDYVYDVKWSPTHPALFGSVDGTGKFSVWNLNDETEGRALNKLCWDKEGKKAAIGSSDGRVHIYDIGELHHPRDDEWNRLQRTISEMIDTTTDRHHGKHAISK